MEIPFPESPVNWLFVWASCFTRRPCHPSASTWSSVAVLHVAFWGAGARSLFYLRCVYTLPVQSSNNGLPYIPRCVCCSWNGDGNTFDVLGCWCRHVSKYHRALSCLMGCQYGSRKEPLAFILDCFTSEFSADQSSPLPAFIPVGYFGLNCVICLIRESMKQSYHSRAQTHCCAKNLLSSPH